MLVALASLRFCLTRTSKLKGASQCGLLITRGVILMLVLLQSSDKGLPSLSMWNLVAKGNNQASTSMTSCCLPLFFLRNCTGAHNTDDCLVW